MSQHYAVNPEVVVREKDSHGALLFNPDTNQLRAINETGFFIWSLCDGSRNIDSLAQAIRDAYEGVPEREVLREVTAFLKTMVADQFLGVVEKN
jgi:hypothetical protein